MQATSARQLKTGQIRMVVAGTKEFIVASDAHLNVKEGATAGRAGNEFRLGAAHATSLQEI